MSFRSLPAAAWAAPLVALLSLTAPAQLGDWSAHSVPAGAPVTLEQSYVLSQNANEIRAFSAFNRRWSTLTTLASAPIVTVWNEAFVVQDGTTFWAYSPHTASFAPLVTLSATAKLVPKLTPQTWIVGVQDGARLYLYFPYSGSWHSYAFAAPPTVSIRNFVAEIADGSSVHGVSAYFESLVPLAVPGAAAAGCFGSAAMATSPGAVHGFSAYRNTWASAAVAGTPALSNGYVGNPGFVAVQDGATIQFFSGQTGTFTTIPAPPTAALALQRQVAVAIDGTTVHAYSGLLGKHATISCAAPPSLVLEQYFALLDDGVGIAAFSAPRGDFAAPLPASGATIQSGQSMALASFGVSPIAAYSAVTNHWETAPPLATATGHVGAAAVVLVDAAGATLHGLSARGVKGWVSEPAPAPDAIHLPNTPTGLAELIVARAGSQLFAFSPQAEAWRSVTMSGSFLASAGHMSAAVFTDGANAYGFGVHNDRWTVEPLGAAPAAANVKAQVDSGYVLEGTTLHAYSALGQTTTANEYPDLYRFAPVGGVLRLVVAGDPFAASYVLASDGPAEIPVPPFGTLLLDLANAFTLAAPPLNGDGLAQVLVPIPNDPLLSGMMVHLQSLVGGGPAGFYLTNCARALLL